MESWHCLASGGAGWTCSSQSGSRVFYCAMTLVLVTTHACMTGPLMILMGVDGFLLVLMEKNTAITMVRCYLAP